MTGSRRRLSDNALRWLEEVVSGRFNASFRLEMVDGLVRLGCAGHDGFLVFEGREGAGFEVRPQELECPNWDGAREGWIMPLARPIPAPSGYVDDRPLIQPVKDGYSIGYDVPGLLHWMLARREEIGSDELDSHDRFPAVASHAFRHGYLERPVVDEWVAVLGQVMSRLWPGVAALGAEARMRVSHDVDSPSRYGFHGLAGLTRTLAGDILKRRSVRAALAGMRSAMRSRTALDPADPDNTFDWLMDQSERYGLTSAFYFICGRTDRRKDARYDPETPAIRRLMRRIHDRGHEIGLHPSYGTYRDPDAICIEATRLRRVCEEEGIRQREWGGRMHYLRWETPTTLYGWEQAGMAYDSSMGYADRPGFRCGTCHEYPAFDPIADRKVDLRIRPLIAMECTVMARRYLGLGATEEAKARFRSLRAACDAVEGTFTLLWHNTEVAQPAPRMLYASLLEDLRQ